jgi:hypothetical protein
MSINAFTLEKMRNLIMESAMCRKDRNCGGCKRVNFCAIWNKHWPTLDYDGTPLEAYSDYKVKDLPVLSIGRIANAVDKTFNVFITYMDNNELLFDDDYVHTILLKKND